MRHFRTRADGFFRVLAPAALVAVLAAGCNAKGGSTIEDPNAPEQTGEAASPDKQVDRAAHMKAFRGGPEKMLRDALSELDLSADQKATIDKALAGARPDGAPGEAMKPVFALVASQVRAGKIDEAAIDAKRAELGGSRDAWRAKAAAALQTVHDTLTADQRSALVSNIESRWSDHEAGEADGDHARGERHHDRMRGDGKPGERMHGKLGFLLHGLDIDDAQREKIASAVEAAGIGGPDRATMEAKRAEMKEKFHAMLEAFKADKFDAASMMPQAGDGPEEHVGKMIETLAVVVPMLDADQREALAKNIENGPGPGAFGHQGWKGHRGEDPAE